MRLLKINTLSAIIYNLSSLLLTFITLLFTSIPAGLAQSNSDDTNIALAISMLSPKKIAADRTLEDRARQILLQQLENEQFLVSVETEFDATKIKDAIGEKSEIRLRTLPKTLRGKDLVRAFTDGVTSDNAFLYFKSIKVIVILDENVPSNLEPILGRALTKGLALRVDRGDAVSISKEKLNLERSNKLREQLENANKDRSRTFEEAGRLQSNVKALESQKLTLEAQRSQLEAAKADVEQRLRIALSDLEKEKKLAEDLQERVNALENVTEEDNSRVGQVRRLVKGLELPATLLPIALVFAIVLIILATAYISSANRRSKNLAAGLQNLAGAVEKMGANSSKNTVPGLISPLPQVSATAQPNPQLGPEAQTPLLGGGDQQMDIARREAEAAWVLMQKRPYPMLSALRDWLLDEADQEKFVAFSDAIGVENARQLWNKFPRQDIENLNKAMFKTIQKSTAYSTVTQLYRFVSYELAGKPAFFENLELEFLVALSDSELAEVLSRCELETAACCFLFVSPKRAAKLYELVEGHSPRDLMSVLGSLSDLNETGAQTHIAALKAEAEKVEPKSGFALSSHLAVLLQASSAEKKDAISEVLDNNDKLSAEVRSRVITFADVMQLEKEIIAELILPLEAEQIAALFLTLPGSVANQLASLLSQKVVIAVREEYNRSNSKPTLRRKATVLGERLQNVIIARVKEMMAEGLIELPTSVKQANRQSTSSDEDDDGFQQTG